MGCGRMSRQGIGWFKLEMVSYPDNSCFLDAKIQKHSKFNCMTQKEESVCACIKKSDLYETTLKESDRSNVILVKKTEVAI